MNSLLILIAHRPPSLLQRCARSALSRQNDAPPFPTDESPRPAPHAHDVPEQSPPLFTPSGHFANGTKEQNSNRSPLREKRRVTRAHLNAELQSFHPIEKRTNAPIKRNQKEGQPKSAPSINPIVDLLEQEILADRQVSLEEANFLFALKKQFSTHRNSPNWQTFFVHSITRYLLEDEDSPGVVDDREAQWLRAHLQSQGRLDAIDRLLLTELRTRSHQLSPPF